VLEFTPGKVVKSSLGLRNCVAKPSTPHRRTLVLHNERDGLGKQSRPDYVTHVQEGGFYGWPWFYFNGPSGGLQDRAIPASTLNCSPKSSPPNSRQSPLRLARNVLLRGLPVPPEFKATASPLKRLLEPRPASRLRGHSPAHAQRPRHRRVEDFLTLCAPQRPGLGPPVGVAQAGDGSLFVSDDGSRSIWHVTTPGVSQSGSTIHIPLWPAKGAFFLDEKGT